MRKRALLAVAALAATASFAFPGCARSSAAAETRSRRPFHELHLGGEPNAAGLALVGARKADRPYRLAVAGGTVTAVPDGPGPVLTGTDLAGLELELRDRGRRRIVLRIDAVGDTRSWAAPLLTVPTYTLTYTTATQPDPRPLCTTTVNEALLFAGDRYDAESKTVTATGPATAGWFNVACAGTALAKLHLVRHTEASQAIPTTAAERQAMLKMFTADVCGDGTAFTVQGQPLLWKDAKGITTYAGTPASREAVWTERGALCLDTPRRPQMEAEIASRCPRPPRCADLPPALLARGHVTSANPR